MSADDQISPPERPWAAAIHASIDDYQPFGSGVVIDDHRVLTCAHVVDRDGDLWIAFPLAGVSQRVLVEQVIFPANRTFVGDLAILLTSEPVPAGVASAPLRLLKPEELVSTRWEAFGFPAQNLLGGLGSSASGQIGSPLGYGWIQLNTRSRHRVVQGFSGSGLWSPEHQAVVAVVGQADDEGDGRAVTLHEADKLFPGEHLKALAREPGTARSSSWGWSLSSDREARRHWEPRARGVHRISDHGFRFRGRKRALEVIKDRLDGDAVDRRVLVVTGDPGAGKSAVLGRIVTTADGDTARKLPAWDTEVRATVGSVSCAVHAKDKSVLEVASEIALAAGVAPPEHIEDFAVDLYDALAGEGRRFNVIIDALDEAISPAHARDIIEQVIKPVAETCANVGAQVIVGSRRSYGMGDLQDAFEGTAELVDLGDAEYFAQDDLVAHTLATLQLLGNERRGNPYASDEAARPVAERIAELSKENFLVAGLTAGFHGLYDESPADPATLSFSPKVNIAMDKYLEAAPSISLPGETPHSPAREVPAKTLLTALAFAEAPGFPVGLWCTALRTLGAGDIPETALIEFAQSSAASFLIESSDGDGPRAAFRLFHQALNEALRSSRAKVAQPAEDEKALAQAFLSVGRDAGWEHAPDYLRRSLPVHAERGHIVDELLADDEYLLFADLRRVLQVGGQAVSSAARDRVRLLGLTPEAVRADLSGRAAMFGVTEALDGLGVAYRAGRWQTPYRARWAVAAPSHESLTLRGHRTGVLTVCALPLDGERALLATAGDDGMVRLWDPADGSQSLVLEGHEDKIRAACTVRTPDRTLLATGGDDGTVRLWDPADGSQVHVLEGHKGRVQAICSIEVGGEALIASGGSDRTVRLWDPSSGSQVRVLEGHYSGVFAVCAVPDGTRTLLASGGSDRIVRLWDLGADDPCAHILNGHRGGVFALCRINLEDGRVVLASGGGDRTVRLWDPGSGAEIRRLEGHQGGVRTISMMPFEGRTLLATGSSDRTIRLWDLAADEAEAVHVLKGHQGEVRALQEVKAGPRRLLATGSSDQTVRLWDLSATAPDEGPQDSPARVLAVCAVETEGRSMLATGSGDGAVSLWDPADGTSAGEFGGQHRGVRAICSVMSHGKAFLVTASSDQTVCLWDIQDHSRTRVLEGHHDEVRAACPVWTEDQVLLATGGTDRTVRLWNLADGTEIRRLDGLRNGVQAICAVPSGDRVLLAIGSADTAVRLWDINARSRPRVLRGHQGGVQAACAVAVGDRVLLATGSSDRTVRLWDPANGAQVRVLEGHQDRVQAVCPVQAGDRVLLASGSGDRTVRLWNPADGRCVLTIPVHHAVLALAALDGSLAIGLETGILVIKLEELPPGIGSPLVGICLHLPQYQPDRGLLLLLRVSVLREQSPDYGPDLRPYVVPQRPVDASLPPEVTDQVPGEDREPSCTHLIDHRLVAGDRVVERHLVVIERRGKIRAALGVRRHFLCQSHQLRDDLRRRQVLVLVAPSRVVNPFRESLLPYYVVPGSVPYFPFGQVPDHLNRKVRMLLFLQSSDDRGVGLGQINAADPGGIVDVLHCAVLARARSRRLEVMGHVFWYRFVACCMGLRVPPDHPLSDFLEERDVRPYAGQNTT